MPSLLDWTDIPDADWARCLDRAHHHRRARAWTDVARHRSIGLVFFNSSLRTRTSMELAATQLGAHATTLDVGAGTGVWGFAWERGRTMDGAEAEHIDEAVGVLSRYYDALGVRVFATLRDAATDDADALLNGFARAASVPVVNLESARVHPCQQLADAATLAQLFGDGFGAAHPASGGDLARRTVTVTWAPHPKPLPRAVPHSAVLAAARVGVNVRIAHPEGFDLAPDVIAAARAYAAARGTTVEVMHDQAAAFDGADAVYAKAWAAPLVYTDPAAEAALRAAHADWTVTEARMRATREGRFLHCLPVRRGVVVEDAVLDGPRTVHLDQAENRLHAQKAILEWMWGVG